MFEKLITDLSLSPASVHELHKYATKTRRHVKYTKTSIVIMLLVILVQLLSIPILSSNNPSSAYQSQAETTTGISQDHEVINLSQNNIKASSKLANPKDRLKYTININNQSSSYITITPSFDLSDILQYANLTNYGDGKIDNNILTWSQVELPPQGTITRSFIITINNPIKSTPRSGDSYDLIMTSHFGNSININLKSTLIKRFEAAILKLPNISLMSSIVISLLIFICLLLSYLYYRQLQLEINILIGITRSK